MDKEFFEALYERVEKYLDGINKFLLNPDCYLSVGTVYDYGGKINIFNWSKKSIGGIVEIVQGKDCIESIFGNSDLVTGDIHYVREELNGVKINSDKGKYLELITLRINGEFNLADICGANRIDNEKRNYVLVNHVKVRKKSKINEENNETVFFKSKGDVLAVNYKSSLVKGFREKIFSLEI